MKLGTMKRNEMKYQGGGGGGGGGNRYYHFVYICNDQEMTEK
jgi:hypothetical protein